jgi:redox-sensitive bicupin YhaK (pirin superfamily)
VPQARFTLPRAAARVNRAVYFFRGAECEVAQRRLTTHARVVLNAAADVELGAGADGAELLLLQGKPIAEPVVQYGPFVMNTRAEIEQAMLDYQRTQFGVWPWPSDGPVHARERGRFAKHSDGGVEDLGGGGGAG